MHVLSLVRVRPEAYRGLSASRVTSRSRFRHGICAGQDRAQHERHARRQGRHRHADHHQQGRAGTRSRRAKVATTVASATSNTTVSTVRTPTRLSVAMAVADQTSRRSARPGLAGGRAGSTVGIGSYREQTWQHDRTEAVDLSPSEVAETIKAAAAHGCGCFAARSRISSACGTPGNAWRGPNWRASTAS